MREFLIALLLCGLVAGCATYQAFKNDAPAVEKQAALCKDAKYGLMLAGAALPFIVGGEDLSYWQNWARGANTVQAAACGN